MGESGTIQKRAQVSTVAENLCGVQKKSLGGFSEGPEERPGVPTGLRSRDCGPYCGSENQSKVPWGHKTWKGTQ